MTESITTDRITAGGTQTSEVFMVRGQMAQWRYPDPFGRLTPEFALQLRDMNLSERGSADVRRGYELYNLTQLAGAETVVGINESNYSAHGVQRLICTPTKVYTDNGTTRQDITGSVTWNPSADQRCQFVQLEKKTFINNTDNQIVTWDGNASSPSNISALTGMPWTKAKAIVAHKSLLMVLRPTEGGVDEITRMRWSDIDRTTWEASTGVWQANNRTEIYEGGAPIVGGVDNWGKLWVFKEDGVYNGTMITNFGRFEYEHQEEFHGFEPISNLSLIARPEFIFGASREGAFVMRPNGEFQLITADNQSEWRELNQSRLQYSVAWVRERDHQVRLLCSSASNTTGHDLVMVWDWNNNAVWFDRPSDLMNYASRGIVSNEEVDLYGSSGGYIYKGNGADIYTDDGKEISWDISMSPNDLGLPNRRKMIVAIRTYIKQKSGSQIFKLIVNLDQGKQAGITAQVQGGVTQNYNTGLLYNNGLLYEGGTNQQLTVFVNRMAELVAPRWFGTDTVELIGYDVEYIILE
jgi:hypothetical protein